MYTFSTLNDKDLEELARDILNKNLNLHLQSFKKGRDKGIDLRYSTNSRENKIVVQVKHFVDSKFAQLLSVLKNKELEKVKILNPERYILVTSLGLTPQNKTQLKELFEPYILSTQDIIGKDELNSYLRDYKDIESKHFKLWLSSTNVINKILNNGILGRSEFTEQSIKNKIKLFVTNKTHSDAVNLLNEYNFLLITGEPGVGKTMLANMLTFELLEKDYNLIHVFDVKEADEKFDSNKKQVFYFDDFLGANYFDLSIAKNNDSAIVHFIERIKSSNNKKLLLTSRTVILNRAKEDSEKIFNSNIDISKYEVLIKNYSNLDKARILYNHIYFSNLEPHLKEVFFENKFYWEIIKHRNYNPRIIEFFTDKNRFQKELDATSYKEIVLEKLKNPKDIWKKTFENQITDKSKLLLTTFFSLQNTNEEVLKKAFNARIKYEIENNGFKKETNLFNTCMNELLGGFLNRKIYNYDNFNFVSIEYFNPSIIDFFLNYLRFEDTDEKWDIIKSSIYFEQLTYRFTTENDSEKNKGKITFETNEIVDFEDFFIDNYDSFTSSNYTNKEFKGINTSLEILNLSSKKNLNFIINKINEFIINEQNFLTAGRLEIILFLQQIERKKLIPLLEDKIKQLFLIITSKINSYVEIIDINQLIESSVDYKNLIQKFCLNDEIFYNQINSQINNFWEVHYKDFLMSSMGLDEVVDEEELSTIIDRRKDFAININKNFSITSNEIFDDEDLIDYDEILSSNRANYIDEDGFIKHKELSDSKHIDEDLMINNLFQRPS